MALILWIAQLVLNGAWSWLFFGLRRMDLAFADVTLLWLCIAAFIVIAWAHFDHRSTLVSALSRLGQHRRRPQSDGLADESGCGMTMSRLFLSAVLLSWLSACVGAGSNTPVTPLAIDQFPEVQGISLLGDDVALPEGFDGEVNLVSMGFEHKHQLDINTWIEAVPNLSEAFPTFPLL